MPARSLVIAFSTVSAIRGACATSKPLERQVARQPPVVVANDAVALDHGVEVLAQYVGRLHGSDP